MKQRWTQHANPQTSVSVGRQIENCSIGPSYQLEVHSVEANQSGLRADPKIAVVRLRDGVYGPSWKSILRTPPVLQILRHCAIRIDRICGLEKRSHEDEDRQASEKCAVEH